MQLRNRLLALNTPIFLIAITILPVFVLFASRGSNAIFAILSVIPCLLLLLDKQWDKLYRLPLNKVLCAWFALGLISLSWSIEPQKSIGLLLQLFLLYFSVIALFYYVTLMDALKQIHMVYAAIIGVLIALLCANIEIIYNGPISTFILMLLGKATPFLLTDLNRSAVVISLLLWPILAYFLLARTAKNYYTYGWLLFLCLLVTVARLESQSATAAIFVGMLVWLLITFMGQRGIYLLTALAGVVIFAIPLTAFYMNPEYVFNTFPMPVNAAPHYRLHIWHFAAEKAAIHPWLGWGFNASRSIPVLPEEYVLGGRHPLPLHPHNNILQIWLELGIAGLLTFFAFIVTLILHIARFTNPQHRALAMALMGSFFMIGATGYGVWQHWFIASGLIATILLTIVFRLDNNNASSPQVCP